MCIYSSTSRKTFSLEKWKDKHEQYYYRELRNAITSQLSYFCNCCISCINCGIYIRFPAKTFTNVGMVQRVIKNRVRAPTHHTGNKSPDTRRGSLASLAIHNP